MVASKDIINSLISGKLVSVKENTECFLNYKLANKIQEKYEGEYNDSEISYLVADNGCLGWVW